MSFPVYGASADGLVTGEAVPVDLRLAQLPSRALAFAIDWLVQILLVIGAIIVLSELPAMDDAYTAGLTILLIVLVFIGYPVAWETLSHGRSLGKLALGLRVVRDDGGAERFRHALVRALFAVVEIWLFEGVPALLCSLFNRRSKRVGDLAAGTVVVRERIPKNKHTWEPRVTQALAPWAAVVDLSRVPDDLALALRQFLARSPSLSRDARAALSQRFLADTLRYVAPAPPPAYADEILAAVVAERRRREELRLQARPAPSYVVPSAPQAPHATAPFPQPPAEGGFQVPS